MTGKLQIAAVGQDGLVKLAAAPQAQAASDPTSGLVLRGWAAVTTLEVAAPAVSPQSLTNLVNATRAAPVLVNPRQLAVGLPVIRSIQIAAVAKAPDVVSSLKLALTASLTPSAVIFKRLQSRVRIPERLGDGTARVMACPQFTAPIAMDLKKAHPDWLLPGLGNFPDNCVTLLHADGAFVEAFLAGANHEMNREFLWRGYPTDQRGTPFRFFWPRPDRVPDIPPMTDWPQATALGDNAAKDGLHVENLIVFLVRGELLHRYPRLIVYAAAGKLNGEITTLDPDFNNWKAPGFALRLDDRTTAFAYDLTEPQVRGKPGYYFVFSEPITGPRFNFDVTTANPMKIWSDLGWERVPQPRGFAFAGEQLRPPPQPQNPEGASWNGDAADMASITFARPFRVAYHADELLAPSVA
jgi:hypothetical protein